MKIIQTILFFSLISLSSCDLGDAGPEKQIGGDMLSLAELGNTFRLYTAVPGVNVSEATVSDVSGGISTTTLNVTVTDENLLAWKDSFPYLKTVNGNTAQIEIPGRVTTEGIQSYSNGEYFTVVKFDAAVGDKYKGKINGKSVVREVISKSSTDDYSYGFFDIKVYKIEERGLGLPGLQKINYFANHKFGLVGIEAVFEDGSTKVVSVFSNN